MVSFILPGNSATGGYEVANSLRFNDGDSANLSRTQVVGDRQTFTFSTWVKRSALGTDQMIFNAASPANSTDFRTLLRFGDADVLQFYNNDATGGGVNMNLKTNRLFRDVSAWYHIVLRFDPTQSTEADRIRLYVNGVQETSFSTATYPSQNADNTQFNYNGNTVKIGGSAYSDGDYFDGYMAEAVLCDGSSLAPTSFGEFDGDSPTVWKPIDVSDLTFGNNGFYLDFEDSSALGTDVSGEGHNYTANNLAATDQSTDTCTNNYATFNPLIRSNDITFTEGNLKITDTAGSNYSGSHGTIAVNSGKWYCEVKVTNTDYLQIGALIVNSSSSGDATGTGSGGMYYYYENIYWQNNNTQIKVYNTSGSGGNASVTGGSNSVNTYSTDIISMALDMDNGRIYFAKNGTYENSGNPANGTNGFVLPTNYNNGNGMTFYAGLYEAEVEINFGSPAFSISSGNSDANGYGNFEYSVPSGYYALNSKNLAEFG